MTFLKRFPRLGKSDVFNYLKVDMKIIRLLFVDMIRVLPGLLDHLTSRTKLNFLQCSSIGHLMINSVSLHQTPLTVGYYIESTSFMA